MSELRIYLHRDEPRQGRRAAWVWRDADGRIKAQGHDLDELAQRPSTRRCHLVLAADLVTCLPAQLPALPVARLEPVLPAAAEAMSLTEAERLHVALLERDAQGISWLALIDRAWLGQRLEQLAARGLRVDAALPESLLLPLLPGEWSAQTREDGGFARLGRSVGIALDTGAPPAALGLALAAPPGGKAPQTLRLYGGHLLPAAALADWQARLGLNIEPMPAWRWEEAGWPESPNLLQGALRPRHKRLEWQPMARTLVLGAAILAGLHLFGTAIASLRLESEQTHLQNELRRLAAQILPAHAAIVDPAWQIQAQLTALRAAHGAGAEDALTRLAQLSALLPAGAPSLRGLEYADGRIVLRYAAGPAAWTEAFLAALAGAQLGANATPDEDGGMRIAIETTLAGEPNVR